MAKEQLSGKALEQVHKIVFLANEYPSKTMQEIAKLFEMPPLDINIAIWRAADMGFLTIDENNKFTIHEVPDKWELGDNINFLKTQLTYYFSHLARDEADLEETYLSNLTAGYPAHDHLIVMKLLLSERILTSYKLIEEIEIPVSKKAKVRGKKPLKHDQAYTFFSLWANSEQQWGRKQFKEGTKLK